MHAAHSRPSKPMVDAQGTGQRDTLIPSPSQESGSGTQGPATEKPIVSRPSFYSAYHAQALPQTASSGLNQRGPTGASAHGSSPPQGVLAVEPSVHIHQNQTTASGTALPPQASRPKGKAPLEMIPVKPAGPDIAAIRRAFTLAQGKQTGSEWQDLTDENQRGDEE